MKGTSIWGLRGKTISTMTRKAVFNALSGFRRICVEENDQTAFPKL